MVCDFCGGGAVRWSYPARSFETEIEGVESEGAWAACDPCRELIERGDRGGLVRRCLDRSPVARAIREMGGEAVAVDTLRGLHDQFFDHRAGPAVPARP